MKSPPLQPIFLRFLTLAYLLLFLLRPSLFNSGRSAAVYSPLSRTERADRADTLPACPCAEADDCCSLCQHALYTEVGGNSTKQVIRLQCGHCYHKVCVLNLVTSSYRTLKEEDICPDCRDAVCSLK